MSKEKEILAAVSMACEVSEEQLKSRSKKDLIAKARGVYFLLCEKHCVPRGRVAKAVGRSHSTAINTSKNYKGYSETDKEIGGLIERASRSLSKTKKVSDVLE